MKSNMTNVFSHVPQANIPRTKFKQVSNHKTAFDCDYLIPFYVKDVLPATTIKFRANHFARIATLTHPLMDNVRLDYFYFFVPS